MRSALLCVFFTLIATHEYSCQSTENDDFSPTPIPLNSWHDKRKNGAGTLQEMTKSDKSSSTVNVPAHYWEDALRHSVYLTLVRDKIDQLIGKGNVSSDNKSNDFDDHDLWEKIKTASFERRKAEGSEWLGDVTMMARGRLLDVNGTLRFVEDEKTQKCNDDKCKEGVKAYWYVKRVRQRDNEATAGKYHYELTFSVTSHTSLKKKPYDNPVRTFTVRETTPTEAKRVHEPNNNRPQRAIWVHRNIAPSQYHKNLHTNQGLDRIFSSIFSDEDTYDDPVPRYRQQNHFIPQNYPQHLKTGYPSYSDPHHQKKMMPYPYKPPTHKYSRPSYQAPFSNVPPYTEFDSGVNTGYQTSSDHRYLSSNVVKTTRPAVLPTPVLPPILPTNPSFQNGTFDNKFNFSDVVTKKPEPTQSYKGHSKPKPTPMKISYFPDHVRPPVYSAPPGVFVTMDKKPFKPMPPLKLIHSSKSPKPKPIDFRPSPQLDIQFSNPNISPDSSFRPINFDYSDSQITTEKTTTKEGNKSRRIIPNVKKFSKKQEKERTEKSSTTTPSPEIITVREDSIEETDAMDWANVLGAFTKTTPMATQKDNKQSVTENTLSETTTVSTTTTTEIEKIETTTKPPTTTTTTTEKPKKRTRPPHKFTKTDKNKKRKPITSTTTSTTNAPEKKRTRTTQDLTAQATSSTTNGKPSWKPKDKPTSTTPMTTSASTLSSTIASKSTTTEQTTTVQSTTVTQSTTTKPVTTPAATSSIHNEVEPLSTIQPRNKNRYRQSTLMYKGTSVKHDKWNATPEKNKTVVPTKFPRRNVSNFQGYTSTTEKPNEEKPTESQNNHSTSTTTTAPVEKSIQNENELKSTTEATYDYSEEKLDSDSTTDPSPTEDSEELEETEEEQNVKEDSEEQESEDHSEFIFSSTSSPNENINEVIAEDITTEQTVITTPFTTTKNKTKCKKKKNQNLAAETTLMNDMKLRVLTSSTTEKATTIDFLDELLSSFDEPKNESARHTNSHDNYAQEDDNKDIEEFLSSLESKNRNSEEDIAYDVEISEEFSPFNNDDDNRASRHANENYGDYQDRFSILELMAME